MKSHASELQGGSSNHPGNSDLENGESLQDHTRTQRYPIPATEFGAVEIPAIVENIDRAILAFGRVPDLRHVSVQEVLLQIADILTLPGSQP